MPLWDPLRGDPRSQKIVASLAQKTIKRSPLSTRPDGHYRIVEVIMRDTAIARKTCRRARGQFQRVANVLFCKFWHSSGVLFMRNVFRGYETDFGWIFRAADLPMKRGL
jgi:hypothetical protein